MSFARHERSQSGQQQTARQLPDVCNDYNRRRGCTRAKCQELHLCTYFLQNRCIAERCNKAHTLETPRNKQLLDGLGWKGIGDMEMALDILRRRDRAQAVSICFNYNMGICSYNDCKHLHVCYRYVMDKQCSPDNCGLSHDLAHGYHNADLLARAGLNDTPETEILRQMQEHVRRYPPKPALCYYSKDCKKHCLRLHYCETYPPPHYCMSGERCHKAYILHNQEVLTFFDWTEAHVLEALREDKDGRSASRPARAQTSTYRDDDRERSRRQGRCEGLQQGPSVKTCVKRVDSAEEVANHVNDLLDSSNKQPKRHCKVREQTARVRPNAQEASCSSQQMEAERQQREAERQQREPKETELKEKERELEEKESGLEEKERKLEEKEMKLEKREEKLEEKERELEEKESGLEEKEKKLEEKEVELEEKEEKLEEKERELEEKERELEEKERELEEKERELEEKEREREKKEHEWKDKEADWRHERKEWQRKESKWEEKETKWEKKEAEWKKEKSKLQKIICDLQENETKRTRETQRRERETYETEERAGEEADDKHRLRTSKRKTENLSGQSVNKKKK